MDSSDDQLVERLKKGDHVAFEMLYERYAIQLLRHLKCLMNNHEEAEEMLHEVMMLMIQKINFYSPKNDSRNNFKGWIYRLSTNRAIDEIRKRKGNRVLEDKEELVVSNSEIYEEEEKKEIIGNLLMKLPLIQRTVLSLRVHEDLSYMEIANICGKDVNTIKQSLFHARRNMKDLMVEHGEII